MRTFYLLFILSMSSQSFACSEALKSFPFECKTQDRFTKLSSEFNDLSVSIVDLKGFKIPKAVGKKSYFTSKNDLLNHTEATLSRNKEWQIWNNGQKFINNLNPVFLEYADVLKLHKVLFGSNSFFDFGSEAGKIRTNNGLTNPKLALNCEDQILKESIVEQFDEYDLKSAEGYPLLVLKNIKSCDDGSYKSADLYYYKGASIKVELNRWLVDFNDMMSRFENGNANSDLSPYQYFSDMRRWFLTLNPFTAGNEQVVDALLDYSAKRLQLSPMPFNDSTNPIFLTSKENQESTLKKLDDNLRFFEGCLYETKLNIISSECSTLK